MGNELWIVTTNCFLDQDGSELNRDKIRWANGGTEKKKKILYSILDRL
ncbi:hypothetical protein [Aquimarina addita]